jgi:cyclophilin family peptidyl-prolyl cis-trans isomerase
MNAVATLVALCSILFPTKSWFAPDQPWTVTVKAPAGQDLVLTLTDFTGRAIDARGDVLVSGGGERTIDLKELFPPVSLPSTYVLWAVPKGKMLPEFVGTPLIVSVRDDKRRDAPPGTMVMKVEPMCYATIGAEPGDVTILFYYDVAPHTVANFCGLSAGGFYDGLTFHRIVPGFIVQGGDPRGDGTGGPGYTIDAEFSDRELREGVLAMSRQTDPLEAQGAPPRPEFANSAGSQFFICLDYERTKQLDRRYTVFGKVVEGMDVVNTISKTPLIPDTHRPATTQPIKTVKIRPVEPGKNPYFTIMNLPKAES